MTQPVVVSESERHDGSWEVCLSADGLRYNVVVSKAVHDGDERMQHYQIIFNERRKRTLEARERAKLIAD